MNKLGYNKLLIILIFALSILSCTKQNPYDKITVGMSKSEIIQFIGNTSAKRYITKTNNQIQGPEKEFWYELAYGTKLEVWTYKSENGSLNLYFIDGESELKYKVLKQK